MTTSHHVSGFWMHISWSANGSTGIDQHGRLWINRDNPMPAQNILVKLLTETAQKASNTLLKLQTIKMNRMNNRNRQDVENWVLEKLRTDYSEPQIKLESVFTLDTTMDSLDLIDLVMQCENHYNIRIEDEQLEKVTTVKELVDIICPE